MAGGFNLGNAVNILGKLATGVGTGIAAYENQSQPDYYFMPRYTGDGLASSSVINNSPNKQRRLDQIFGAGDYLSSLFGNGSDFDFSQMKDKVDTLLNKPMFNDLRKRSDISYPLQTETFTLPRIGSKDYGTIGDYGKAYDNWHDYSLPTRQTNYKLPWE